MLHEERIAAMSDELEKMRHEARQQSLAENKTDQVFTGAGCLDAYLHIIREANQTIEAAAFCLTHGQVVEALLDAIERGVNVRILVD